MKQTKFDEELDKILFQLERSAFIDGQHPIKEEADRIHLYRKVERISRTRVITQIKKLIDGVIPEKDKNENMKGIHRDLVLLATCKNHTIDEFRAKIFGDKGRVGD
jgi:hypothetical protein